MSELIRKNASELVDLLKSGQVSSVEVTQAHLDRTAAVDDAVHSYLHVGPEAALAAAADIDRRRLQLLRIGRSLRRSAANVPFERLACR